MAEERLIDDDKDRKYKVVKNADGEEELVIDTSPEEPEEELGFEVPELSSDDEEAAVMTPEQLAERERMRAEAGAANKAKLKEISARAEALLEEGKLDDAGYVLAGAEDLGDDGEIYALKLRAITRDFSDFSNAEEGEEAVEGVKKFAPKEVVESLSYAAPTLQKRAEELKTEVAALDKENEDKKSERRTVFRNKRNHSAIFFAAAAVPFIVFAALAIYYGTHLTAVKDGANIPLFITFISLAGVFFVATLFAAKALWKNANNLKLNEKNSSTKLGRSLEEKKAELKLVEGISEILEGNDLS